MCCRQCLARAFCFLLSPSSGNRSFLQENTHTHTHTQSFSGDIRNSKKLNELPTNFSPPPPLLAYTSPPPPPTPPCPLFALCLPPPQTPDQSGLRLHHQKFRKVLQSQKVWVYISARFRISRRWFHFPNMGAAETIPPTHRYLFFKFGPNMGNIYLNNTFNCLIVFFCLIPISLS